MLVTYLYDLRAADHRAAAALSGTHSVEGAGAPCRNHQLLLDRFPTVFKQLVVLLAPT